MSTQDSNQNLIPELGPLAVLEGEWAGDKGDDIAPDDNRGTENNKFHEVIRFENIGCVNNHEQTLYGLRYSKKAWRIGAPDPFHEEVGYWLWDAKNKQVIFCFIVPRGVSVIAGGTVSDDARTFQLSAKQGSATYGICSNQFLDQEFKTVYYDVTMKIHDHNSFTYEEDTHLLMKGREQVFHHTDRNTLKRVK